MKPVFSSPRRVPKKNSDHFYLEIGGAHATNLFGSVTEAWIAAGFKKQSTLGR
jgi:hypothetical protein